MYSYKVRFFTTTKEIGFVMKSSQKEEVEEFTYDLLDVFVKFEENEKPKLNTLQKYSETNEKFLSEFIQKYRTRLPQLNALSAFLKKLHRDQYFIFLPNLELDQVEQLKLNDYLKTIAEGKKYSQPTNYHHPYYGDLLNSYTIHFVGNKRVSIGERDKNKRECRFCGGDNSTTSFNNKAHAISEALGNKTIIIFDECDSCNKKFSETIEPDIIIYLSLFRTMFGVKGKRGNKKIQGKNFKLQNEEGINLAFNSIADRPNFDNKNYKLHLNFGHTIISQNVYKTLCKYFLSVIDKKHLIHFNKTIEWIRGNIIINQLPKIAEKTTYEVFTIQPELVYYLRKDDSNNLPFAVCEFRFTCKILVFIVPLSDADGYEYLKEAEYGNFWSKFKHYQKSENWAFKDFSNSNPRDFSINLDFEVNSES